MRRIALLLAALLACACNTGALDVSPAPTTGSAGECATCHTAEFRSAPHHEGEKPTTCATCHSQDAWRPTRLQHAWPLTGAHRKAPCFYCHKGQPRVFLGTPRNCYGCHRANYEKAPRHVAEHFPTACERCHTTTSWKQQKENAAIPPPPPIAIPLATTPSPAPRPRATARRRPVTRRPTPRPAPRPRPAPTPAPQPTPARRPTPQPTRRPDVTSGASQTR